MTIVDPGRFRVLSASRAMEQTLAQIDANRWASDSIKGQFQAESKSWLALDLTDDPTHLGLMRSWGYVQAPAIAFLSLLLTSTDSRWVARLASFRESVDAFNRGLITSTDRLRLLVLAQVEDYDFDGGTFPSSWRSRSALEERAPSRLSELTSVIALVEESPTPADPTTTRAMVPDYGPGVDQADTDGVERPDFDEDSLFTFGDIDANSPARAASILTSMLTDDVLRTLSGLSTPEHPVTVEETISVRDELLRTTPLAARGGVHEDPLLRVAEILEKLRRTEGRSTP